MKCHHNIVRNIAWWNSLLAIYAQEGKFEAAKKAYRRMPQRNTETFIWMSVACVSHGKLFLSQHLFEKSQDKDIWAWNTLLSANAQNGHFQEAKIMFKRLPRMDVDSWKCMISAYLQLGKLHKARKMFYDMPRECRTVDAWDMLIQGFGTSDLVDAKKMFERMPERAQSSWAIIIECYAKQGQHEQAISILKISPRLGTPFFARLIKAFGISNVNTAMNIFNARQNHILWGSDAELWNAILEVCCESKELTVAKRVFDAMPARNRCTWKCIFLTGIKHKSAAKELRRLFDDMPERDASWYVYMICAYARQGHPKEALNLFRVMDLDGLRPDHNTYTTALFVSPSVKEKEIVRKAMHMCPTGWTKNITHL